MWLNMNKLTAWDRVTMARMAKRPKTLDYISHIFERIYRNAWR